MMNNVIDDLLEVVSAYTSSFSSISQNPVGLLLIGVLLIYLAFALLWLFIERRSLSL